MPIYEFHCKECRSEFKTLRSASQLDETICPECGTDRVARLLSVTARAQPSSDACALPPAGGCGRAGGCGCRSAMME